VSGRGDTGSEPDLKRVELVPLSEERFKAGLTVRRIHDSDARFLIAAALFVALVACVVAHVHYASVTGFKETCAIDQLFDPITAALIGALTTILGFYFADRRRE
jgi:hypothetical protein